MWVCLCIVHKDQIRNQVLDVHTSIFIKKWEFLTELPFSRHVQITTKYRFNNFSANNTC